MFLDHPAAKILSGVVIGGIFGLLAFETVHVAPAGPAQSEYSSAPAQADVLLVQGAPAAFEAAAREPATSRGGAVLPSAQRGGPRRATALLRSQATFACATRPGAPKVRVGWALSLSGARPAMRSHLPAPATAYVTSLSWGDEAMSLAVSCSPGAAAAKPAAVVAHVPASRPMVPLDYPAGAQTTGLQISGLFKPVTDAMP
jgi:hypothetical protein